VLRAARQSIGYFRLGWAVEDYPYGFTLADYPGYWFNTAPFRYECYPAGSAFTYYHDVYWWDGGQWRWWYGFYTSPAFDTYKEYFYPPAEDDRGGRCGRSSPLRSYRQGEPRRTGDRCRPKPPSKHRRLCESISRMRPAQETPSQRP
jgi:hypothetical protein